MAILGNTFTTYDAKGLREDLTDIIWNISPTETPFTTGIARAKSTAVFHEWQTDVLEPPNGSNAQVQGDDISAFDQVIPTVRLGNYTQISRKTVVISMTEEAVDKAGRKNEMGYQVAKKGKSLKRDIETILLQNQARLVGNKTGPVAALAGSVLSFIHTNTQMGVGGANPTGDGTNARTDGTVAPFTEGMLQSALASVWQNSGDEPEKLFVNATQKVAVSKFNGNNTRYINADEQKLVTSIDVYVYDFGSIEVVPDRFMRMRDALIINTDLWALAWLRPINLVDLAKTGDNEKKLMVGEYTLEARNEAGSGGVFDLQ